MRQSLFTVWTPEYAAALREFLKTPAGNAFISALFERTPTHILKTAEDATVLGGQVAGYQTCLLAISQLCEPPPTEEPQRPSAYPPLDDDSAWTKVDAGETTT